MVKRSTLATAEEIGNESGGLHPTKPKGEGSRRSRQMQSVVAKRAAFYQKPKHRGIESPR
jgi:hypothetical protein